MTETTFLKNPGVRMERLCCPLLSLEISGSADPANWILKLTGPEG